MATARLSAVLGIETDGASRSIESFSTRLGTLRNAIQAAFAIQAIRQFAQMAEELKRYQDEYGIQLVDADTLANIDHAGSKLRTIMMQLKAGALDFGSGIVAGIEAGMAYLGARGGGSTPAEAWGIAGAQVTEKTPEQQAAETKAVTEAAAKSLADQAKERENTEKEIARLQEKIAANRRRNELEAMTGAEKEAAIAKELERAKWRSETWAAGTVAQLEAEAKMVELEGELGRIQRDNATKQAAADKQRADDEKALGLARLRQVEEEQAARDRIVALEADAAAEKARIAAETVAPMLNADSAIRMGAVIGQLANPATRAAERAIDVALQQLEVQRRTEQAVVNLGEG